MMAVIWDDGRHCSNSMRAAACAFHIELKEAIKNAQNAAIQPKIR
jgi:hypothetical protein